MKSSLSIFLFSLTFLSTSLFAEEAQVETTAVETKAAEPLDSVTLPFPSELRINGNEGWVELSYIVDKEGKVKDPIILASVGGPAFEKTAKEALNNLKYTPAVYKGTTVEQSVGSEVVEFLLDQTFEGIDQGFSNAYNEMIFLYKNNNTEEGDAALDKLAKSQDLTLEELSMLELARGHSAAQRGKPMEQLQHIRNASVNTGKYLATNKEMLMVALQTRFALAVKNSFFNEAFATYNLIEAIDPLYENLTALALVYAPMKNAVDIGQLISVKGEIGQHGHFAYTPIRRVFAFASAEEGVTEFEPRCANKNQRFPVNTQNEWKIPESWGECSVVIYGTPGAKFELYEHASLEN